MKTQLAFIAIWAAGAVGSLAQTSQLAGTADTSTPSSIAVSDYAVVERGANHRVMAHVTVFTNHTGRVFYRTNTYTALGTGMHHLVADAWVESSDQISITANGAEATNSQHSVFFNGNINTAGAVTITLPGGDKSLVTSILGICYWDGTNSVMIAETKDSSGQLLPSGSQVLYPDAFSGLKGDVFYENRIDRIEQIIVLRESPPAPSEWGLNDSSAMLGVITEMINPPTPAITAASGDDQFLDFGSMKMGQGEAFAIGFETNRVGVQKQWLMLSGRHCLVEQVPYRAVLPALQQLPAQGAGGARLQESPDGVLHRIASYRLLPKRKMAKGTVPRQSMRLASAGLGGAGLAIDFTAINGNHTNYTFKGDSTYEIVADTTIYNAVYFEGGTVIKASNNVSLTIAAPNPTISFLSGAYRPVIFTGIDDSSVGEPIRAGTLTNYATYALNLPGPVSATISNARIACAKQAINISGSGATVTLRDVQFVNCKAGVGLGSATVYMRNALFANSQTNLIFGGGSVNGQNLTFAGSAYLSSGSSGSLTLTNCILANLTNLTNGALSLAGAYNAFYNTAQFGSTVGPPNGYPFQTVGAGSYYLADGSNLRDIGTTNIDSALLADLAVRTTYPPIAFTNLSIAAPTTWSPQAQRDYDVPDIGWHYSPLDFAVSAVSVGSTLALSNGVAIASFQASGIGPAPGLQVGGGLISVGTPLVHNQICHYPAVQEQPIKWGNDAPSDAIPILVVGSGYVPTVLEAHFTDFSGLSGLGTGNFGPNKPIGVSILWGDTMQLIMRDCRVGPGWFGCDTYDATGHWSTNVCINNLFERGGIQFSDFDGDSPVVVYNNLFRYSTLTFDNENLLLTWEARDNLFDTATNNPGGGGFVHGHNGYANTTPMSGSQGGDKPNLVTDYQVGALGIYYYPTNSGNLSQLIDQGSRGADAAGLYHYTTATNQVNPVFEGFSTVDIGFHYVAVDSNGEPLDTNQDLVPDYLQDGNGNGNVDSGEADWQDTQHGDTGLRVLITRPKAGTKVP
jgi:hypothetical protein